MIRNYEHHEGERWLGDVAEKGLVTWSPPADAENGPSTRDAELWAVEPDDSHSAYGHFNCLEEGGVLADTPAEFEGLIHEG